MDSVSSTKVILYILNAISFALGFSIAAASIWFFVQIQEIISLRNSNHYLLDYNIYWPQAIPWVFFIVAIFVLSVACCGFTGISKNSHNLLIIYVICLSIVIIALIAATIIALVLADDVSIEKFVKDIVWDVYSEMKTDKGVMDAFGSIERRLHCCGVASPRDYRIWKDEFPMSCCDGYNYGWWEPYTVDCKFSNKFANERHGCAAVIAQYAGITIKVLSSASIFTALIAVITLIITVLRYPEFRTKISTCLHRNI